MGEMTFFDKTRELIGGLAFRIFLWASQMTKEEYLKQVEVESTVSADVETVVSWQRYSATCFNCGITKDLCMVPHRDRKQRMVGWLFACLACQGALGDKELKIELSR